MDDCLIKFYKQLNAIIIGKREKIKILIANILAGGNILLEDVPGVGKTTLAKAIARSISSKDPQKPISFMRIQATPDLLPYDITGIDVFDASSNKFIFRPGPLFTDILLADELNRTTPKVQSALLQAMAEKNVTIGRRTYKLSGIFFVIATQNPVEAEGTYPLPAAQLDRFSSCISLGYPDLLNEQKILKRGKSEDRLNELKPVITSEKILEIRKNLDKIEVNNKIINTIANICKKSRNIKDLRLGLSTRAALMMVEMLRAYAYLKKRDYVTDQDLSDISGDVWGHRIIPLNPQLKKEDIIKKITSDEVKKIFK